MLDVVHDRHATPYYLHLDQDDEAAELVKKYHYSHRVPSNVQVVATAHEQGGLFGDLGRAVAACYVSIPGSGHYSINGVPVPTLELTRLVRRDDLDGFPLTKLISWALVWVWRLKKGDLVISFADVQQGHHGGVYQAASWFYDGLRDPNAEGVLVDGKFIPMRTIISHKKAREQFKGRTVEVKWDNGKHCYWKPLSRSGEKKAKLIGLERRQYPRPDDPPAEIFEQHVPTTFCSRVDRHARSECGYFRGK